MKHRAVGAQRAGLPLSPHAEGAHRRPTTEFESPALTGSTPIELQRLPRTAPRGPTGLPLTGGVIRRAGRPNISVSPLDHENYRKLRDAFKKTPIMGDASTVRYPESFESEEQITKFKWNVGGEDGNGWTLMQMYSFAEFHYTGTTNSRYKRMMHRFVCFCDAYKMPADEVAFNTLCGTPELNWFSIGLVKYFSEARHRETGQHNATRTEQDRSSISDDDLTAMGQFDATVVEQGPPSMRGLDQFEGGGFSLQTTDTIEVRSSFDLWKRPAPQRGSVQQHDLPELPKGTTNRSWTRDSEELNAGDAYFPPPWMWRPFGQGASFGIRPPFPNPGLAQSSDTGGNDLEWSTDALMQAAEFDQPVGQAIVSGGSSEHPERGEIGAPNPVPERMPATELYVPPAWMMTQHVSNTPAVIPSLGRQQKRRRLPSEKSGNELAHQFAEDEFGNMSFVSAPQPAEQPDDAGIGDRGMGSIASHAEYDEPFDSVEPNPSSQKRARNEIVSGDERANEAFRADLFDGDPFPDIWHF